MKQIFPLLTPPVESSYIFHDMNFSIRLNQFQDYFQSHHQIKQIKRNDSNQYIQQYLNQSNSKSSYNTFVHENMTPNLFQNYNFLQHDFEKQSESFFIELVGIVPRVSFIRNLLLMIFPNGIKGMSIQKIKRTPLKDLLRIIGENLHFIQSYFSEEIKHQWIQSYYEILKST
jgi:hypothetical protein